MEKLIARMMESGPIRRAEVAALVARVVDEDLRVTFHLDASDPLDFAKEADVRAILEGEWVYCPPVSNTPAAWLTFSENGNFRMRVKDPESGMVWEDAGFCQLDRWNAGENEAPDMLMLTLSQTAANGPANRPMSSAGDYLIVQKTLCDGEIMLSLLQLNNGDSTFSVCFDDGAPVLKKDTGWQPQSERREGDAFYAAVWKVDGRLVWLDDATEDGSNIWWLHRWIWNPCPLGCWQTGQSGQSEPITWGMWWKCSPASMKMMGDERKKRRC